MRRRNFLAGAGAATIASGTRMAVAANSQNAIPLLPVLDSASEPEGRIKLDLRIGAHDFGTGTNSDTFGINQSYLGPVIRVKQGQTLPFEVSNYLNETATLHWHGLHIPGEVDGGPHQEIMPEQTWSPEVPITQSHSLNWYHSHTHGKTAQQVYKGLAGVMLVEDDDSLSADLPQTYGVDDFVLVLQDKDFDGQGRLNYQLTGRVFENGFKGETLVINGRIAPCKQQVPKGLIRLRILNACNARTLTLSMKEGPLTVIGSDGGFLRSSVEANELEMFAGERYEVLIDMRTFDSNALEVDLGDRERTLLSRVLGIGNPQVAVTFTQNGETGFDGSLPNQLSGLAPADPKISARQRTFRLQMYGGKDLAALAAAWGNFCGDGPMMINGQPMKMDRIDETVRHMDTEIWRISADEDPHPFHIHGCSFRILKQNGKTPPSYAQGWKDMVNVEDGWSEVLVNFKHKASEKAPFMYHCHILEHEDCGMMGQFTVS